jgi:hypothetical protein
LPPADERPADVLDADGPLRSVHNDDPHSDVRTLVPSDVAQVELDAFDGEPREVVLRYPARSPGRYQFAEPLIDAAQLQCD